MENSYDPSSAREQRLNEVLAAYFEAVEAGRAVDREQLLKQHPDLAEDLTTFFAEQEGLAGLAAPLRAIVQVATSAPGAMHPSGNWGHAGASAPPASLPGPLGDDGVLGDFRIVREVGRGGMGVVYEAEQRSLRRRVALKMLPFAAALDPRQLRRFHTEAQAAAQLHHTSIVPVYSVGCERGTHFYAMQFIEGQSLAAVIKGLRRQAGLVKAVPEREAPAGGSAEADRTTAYTPAVPIGSPAAETQVQPAAALSSERSAHGAGYFRTVARLGVQGAEALEHAHQQGVIHRDIKPANLLVDVCGNLWVTDFGLARLQSDAGLTMSGDLVGTLRYMSPEQALAQRVLVDHRTDIYSLGASLYELLTLQPAFTGSDRQELLRQIAFEEPRPPRRLNKAIPADLETIVLKALEKNPSDRYATAQALADDLRRFLEDRPIRARRPTLGQRLRKWGRRHQAAVAAAIVWLVAALSVLGGSIGWVLRDRAARWDEDKRRAREALEEAVELQRKERWPDALNAVKRAEEALAGGKVAPELWRQAQELNSDLEMAKRLEEARL
jgi:serine/threonine protein kinase